MEVHSQLLSGSDGDPAGGGGGTAPPIKRSPLKCFVFFCARLLDARLISSCAVGVASSSQVFVCPPPSAV